MQNTHNSICKNETALAQLSTDIKTSASDDDDTRANIPILIYIPQYRIFWGGKSTDNIAAKWKRSVTERAKRRAMKEANSPRFRSRRDIWKKIVIDGN